jgi:hypothetical protein
MNPLLLLPFVLVVTAAIPSSELTQKWWEWVSDIPIKESPLFDRDGNMTQKHMYQKEDNVYFLTGYINSKNAPGQLSETRQITLLTTQ